MNKREEFIEDLQEFKQKMIEKYLDDIPEEKDNDEDKKFIIDTVEFSIDKDDPESVLQITPKYFSEEFIKRIKEHNKFLEELYKKYKERVQSEDRE